MTGAAMPGAQETPRSLQTLSSIGDFHKNLPLWISSAYRPGLAGSVIFPAVRCITDGYVHRIAMGGHSEINARQNAAASDFGLPNQFAFLRIKRVHDAGFRAGYDVLLAVGGGREHGCGAEIVVGTVLDRGHAFGPGSAQLPFQTSFAST